MTNATDTLEDEYSEFDEFEDEEDERGLSGFAVLIMGLVMIGAFFSVVWIAYQQGLKNAPQTAQAPYVAADPEPIKIETADAGETVVDREVYDVFDGEASAPATVLAEGPEEPVERGVSDPIGELAADAEAAAEAVSDEVEDRLASLKQEDAKELGAAPETDNRPTVTATPPTNASATSPRPVVRTRTAADALSGSHVLQVGAFRSDAEALAQWARMQANMGDFLEGKSEDIERADLGDRGVYHRLRIGPFATSAAASEYCAGLKARGQDCLIKKL